MARLYRNRTALVSRRYAVGNLVNSRLNILSLMLNLPAAVEKVDSFACLSLMAENNS